MAKVNSFALIIILAIAGLALFSSFSGTGFVAAGCNGNAVLELSPRIAQLNEPITANVKGLNNCLGQRVLIREGSDLCNGQVVATYVCTSPGCDNSAIFYKGAAKDYKLTACIDKNNNGYLIEQGERSTATLQVTNLPDFTIESLSYSTTPKANYRFTPMVTIKNQGISKSAGINVKIEVWRNEPNRVVPISVTSKEYKALYLGIGDTKQLELQSLLLTSGSYTIKVAIDPDNFIVETDEKNNERVTTLKL
ncbi:MAG: hypothetical protein J4451_02395 [DPANN group archaeon]|nr:hypothetical protein [DPANN group archaeon]